MFHCSRLLRCPCRHAGRALLAIRESGLGSFLFGEAPWREEKGYELIFLALAAEREEMILELVVPELLDVRPVPSECSKAQLAKEVKVAASCQYIPAANLVKVSVELLYRVVSSLPLV